MYSNNISQFVSKPKEGKRWVVGDIHGCPNTFRILVEEHLKFQLQDQLFLLGDYIDRGPDSGAVIDYILSLQQQGFQVFPLMGNHEEMLIESYEEYKDRKEQHTRFLRLLKIQKCYGMLDEHEQLRPHYIDFIQNLPYFYELDEFFLLHASFNFEAKNPFEDISAMVWGRKHSYHAEFLKGKRLIHGHTPTNLENIREAIQQKKQVIPLDNGCVFAFRSRKVQDYYSGNLGTLCALNLDTFELISLPNQEEPF